MATTKKVKWGILGYARIAAKSLIPAVQASTNAELYAIASRDEDKARKAAEEHRAKKACVSYQALLDDPDVEAVYIPLPNSMHAEWTIKAAEKGKHVLCEKPIAVSIRECQEMIDACRKNKVKLMEAFMYRFHPQNVKVKELIKEGAIGQVQLIRASFSFNLTDPSNIRLRKELGGGAMMDVGCYVVSLPRFILEAEPEEVYAAVHFGRESKVDEIAAGFLKFPGGVLAQFDCGFRMGRRQSYEVVGENGVIAVPLPFVTGMGHTKIMVSDMKDITTETITILGVDQYRLEVEHFSDCIITGGEPMYSGEDALKNMKVIEAVYRSGESSKIVDLRL
jgi:predicted dehydrogenase